jgi:hypothetical protein
MDAVNRHAVGGDLGDILSAEADTGCASRANVDDAALCALEHPRQRRSAKLAAIVQIDHEVQPPPVLGEVADDLLYTSQAVSWKPQRESLTARGDDLTYDSFGRLEIGTTVATVADCNSDAVARQLECDSTADRARAVGDDAAPPAYGCLHSSTPFNPQFPAECTARAQSSLDVPSFSTGARQRH